MLPCVCSVIDHRRRQNVLRTSVTLGSRLVCHVFVLTTLLNRRRATWNLLYNYIITQVILALWLVLAYDLLEERRTSLGQLVSLLYKTNIFHVTVRLFSDRSQKTSKCVKNISDKLGYRLVCQFFCSYHILTSSAICRGWGVRLGRWSSLRVWRVCNGAKKARLLSMILGTRSLDDLTVLKSVVW